MVDELRSAGVDVRRVGEVLNPRASEKVVASVLAATKEDLAIGAVGLGSQRCVRPKVSSTRLRSFAEMGSRVVSGA